jgi:Arm DNA-binding domain
MGGDMASSIHRLNALAVNRATKREYYPGGAGLYLQVSAAGTKSWIFRFTSDGRARDMGIGSLNDFALAEMTFRIGSQLYGLVALRWGNRPASLWIAEDFGCCASG